MKLLYDKEYQVYRFNDWEIEKCGGFITVRHWWVKNDKAKIYFWQSTRKEAITLIEKIIKNRSEFDNLDNLYKKSLY